MFSNKYTDKDLISDLKSENSLKESRALNYFKEKNLPIVKSIFNKLKLNEADFDFLYNDALYILYKNISSDKFHFQSKLSTYFYSIFKNRAVTFSKFGDKYLYKELNEDADVYSFELFGETEKKELLYKLNDYINSLRKLCKDILLYSFFYNLKNHEILERINEISSADSLKTQKYKCIKELAKILKQDNQLYNELKELI